jgi:hypothetical protein
MSSRLLLLKIYLPETGPPLLPPSTRPLMLEVEGALGDGVRVNL